MTLLDAALIPHGRTVFEKSIMAASLDHAMWFHRPFRADEWLLYAQDTRAPPAVAASRAASSSPPTAPWSPRSPRKA